MSAPDPTTFPDPEKFATYMPWRDPQFKTHKTLAHAKNSIAGKTNGGKMRCDCWVYEFDFETGVWKELAYIPAGTVAKQHPWYSQKQSAKREILGPSEKAVDAAIASIMKVVG